MNQTREIPAIYESIDLNQTRNMTASPKIIPFSKSKTPNTVHKKREADVLWIGTSPQEMDKYPPTPKAKHVKTKQYVKIIISSA